MPRACHQVPWAILLSTLAACTGGPGSPAPRPRDEPATHVLTPRPRADFTAEGVVVGPASGAAWAFRATPRGFGCDGALAALGRAAPAARGGRVEYARPELREWYVASARGLEQGFTIPAPPACRGSGGHGVVLALGGGLDAVVAEGSSGREARLHDASGKTVLRYTDLHVIDAAGRELPARLEALGEGLSIRFDDTGATYPVEVDPMMWLEQQKLVDVLPGFGLSVAVSGDTAVVGAPVPKLPSVVDVFVRSGGAWNEQQALTVGDGGSELGGSVAVGGDTLLVGAIDELSAGTVFFFTRTGTTWTQTQQVATTDSPIVPAVAISGDTAVISTPNYATFTYVLYVYVLSGTTWTVQQLLTNGVLDGGHDDLSATSVALSGDTAIVGAPTGTGSTGVAYVFVRSGTTWTVQQELTASDGTFTDGFGTSVAVAGDTALVGAPNHAMGQGAVYVFTRSGTTWTQQQEVTAESSILGFGTSVALTDATAVVGSGVLTGPPAPGAVIVYASSGGSLSFQQVLTVSDGGLDDAFGAAIALDGTTLLAGAPGLPAAFVFKTGAPLGAACTSADGCFDDSCVDGVCCGVASCSPAGECNAAETCQAGTGTCSVTPIHEGMACGQGDLCTLSGTCQGGSCSGGAVVCAPADDCHEFGACDPTTGTCSTPAKADGQPCSAGVCTGGVCVAQDGGTDGGGGGSGGGAGSNASSHGGCACEVGGDSGGGPDGAPAPAVGLALLCAAGARARRRTTEPRRASRRRP